VAKGAVAKGAVGKGGSGQGGGGQGGSGQGGNGGAGGGSGSASGSQSSGLLSSDTSGGTGSTMSSSSSLSPDQVPGVRGFPDFLKIDISRLPRRDQLLASEQGRAGRISDVKTVAYFVDDPSTTPDGVAGLRRCEVARAESLMSLEEGTDEQLMRSNSKVLAEEVVRIRFEYNDGTQWYENWPPAEPTTEEEAAQLPLAVHVVLYLKPPGFDEEYGGQAWGGIDMSTFPQRRLIVPLPAAEPPDASAGTTSPDSSSPDSSNSSSSNSSNTSGNSSGSTPSTGASGGTSSRQGGN
jgi:hypothetical protein